MLLSLILWKILDKFYQKKWMNYLKCLHFVVFVAIMSSRRMEGEREEEKCSEEEEEEDEEEQQVSHGLQNHVF